MHVGTAVKRCGTLQVFLKQDLLENFLEDVSVLHGRCRCLENIKS